MLDLPEEDLEYLHLQIGNLQAFCADMVCVLRGTSPGYESVLRVLDVLEICGRMLEAGQWRAGEDDVVEFLHEVMLMHDARLREKYGCELDRWDWLRNCERRDTA